VKNISFSFLAPLSRSLAEPLCNSPDERGKASVQNCWLAESE
jgi:hypothetical protein